MPNRHAASLLEITHPPRLPAPPVRPAKRGPKKYSTNPPRQRARADSLFNSPNHKRGPRSRADGAPPFVAIVAVHSLVLHATHSFVPTYHPLRR
jgi:hypothetical protein